MCIKIPTKEHQPQNHLAAHNIRNYPLNLQPTLQYLLPSTNNKQTNQYLRRQQSHLLQRNPV